MKESKYHRFLLSLGLVFSAINFWLCNKVPKIVLIVTIMFFGYLAMQASILFSQVKQFIIPSLQAVLNGSPETPLIIFSWSYFILFTFYFLLQYACSIKKWLSMQQFNYIDGLE